MRRGCLRGSLFVAGILLVICLKLIHVKYQFSPKYGLTDLRNHEKSLPILSAMIEPRQVNLQQNLFLLVIVCSSPDKHENMERRDMIRKTWGNINAADVPRDVKWKTVFMMGKPQDVEIHRAVMSEHKQHGDLLIGDYKDEYRNISTKLLMAFQWASKIKFNYILKTDDDVYVDIPWLTAWLKARGDEEFLYAGRLYSGPVQRDKTHRHYVAPDDLSLDYYPVFCKGAMYVLSRNLLTRMVDLSKHIKRIGPDDAYVGLLAYQLGVKATGIPEFFQQQWLHWFIGFISACQFQTIMAIGDSLTPSQVFYIHQVKTSSRETVSSLCLSLYTKLCLLLFLICTILVIFLCKKRRQRLRVD